MRSFVLVAIIGLLGGLAACSAGSKPLIHAQPVSVALSSDLEGHAGNGRPILQVEVGGGQPIWVELDTGSVGLRVLASAVGTGHASIGQQTDSVTYQDGMRLTGVIATAPVRIGTVDSSAVPFELVRHVGCGPNRPACPHLGSASRNGAPKISGILGVGLRGAVVGGPSNPFLSLPAPYDESWSIAMGNGGTPKGSGGRLVLGAPPPAHPTETFHLSLDSAITTTPSDWADSPTLCWRLGTHKQCGEAHFDTGSSDLFLTGMSTGRRVLPAGTSLDVDESGSSKVLWHLRGGDFPDDNVIAQVPGNNPTINLGVPFFYTHTVSFDETYGLIVVS